MPKIELKSAKGNELTTRQLYQLLRMRSEVLVVEHQSPYQDLDGYDLDETTTHIWAEEAGAILGCLRLVRESASEVRLGRLCVAHQVRGRGTARRMVDEAIKLRGDSALTTHTRTHLSPWYERFGFVAVGPAFNEVGIPHIPMQLG
jgi:ElaA protein